MGGKFVTTFWRSFTHIHVKNYMLSQVLLNPAVRVTQQVDPETRSSLVEFFGRFDTMYGY